MLRQHMLTWAHTDGNLMEGAGGGNGTVRVASFLKSPEECDHEKIKDTGDKTAAI